MEKVFYGSLCDQGRRGGAIYVDNEAIAYKNQTLTLPEEYKNIIIPIKEIERIEKGCMLLFPTVTIYLKNHRHYKFIIFNRKRFLDNIEQFSDGK